MVVKTIRDIIRAEDLIFRWGGDEIFVLMISMDADMAAMRMTPDIKIPQFNRIYAEYKRFN